MTSPIGFTTGSQRDSQASTPSNRAMAEMRGASFVDTPERELTHSAVADYAYRIAMLTAGIALFVTFL